MKEIEFQKIVRIEGAAIPLRGDDIDTDRIVPARFLRAISFEGLEAHVFEDDRTGKGKKHPFENPIFRTASILLVNRNFGCGSSREHAPQALFRWGVRAVVGESFSEIFLGNAGVLGMPCVTVAKADLDRLMELAESAPGTTMTIDLERETIEAGSSRAEARAPAAQREAFLTGLWNPTAMLLAQFSEVTAMRDRLPYMRGFERS